MAFADAFANWHQCRDVPTQQLCGVIRHEERADAATAFGQGDCWHHTEDMKKWPLDPPLTENGVLAAGTIGHRVRSVAQDCGVEVHIIVSSPYLRCIQTAVEICHALGPSTRLLVDFSLGELYGPMAMGLMEPNHVDTVHPMEHTLELCRARGVDCKPHSVGCWPTWPETLRSARRRFASRFLTYMRRGLRMRQNFLVVSHGDCVGAALSMMPSEAGLVSTKVDFGGMFLAQRQLQTFNPEMSPHFESPSSCPHNGYPSRMLNSDSPALQISGSEESDETKLDVNAQEHGHSRLASRRLSISTFSSNSSDRSDPPPPPDSDGWHVQSYGIKQLNAGSCQSATLAHRLKDLIDTECFPPQLIEQLLMKHLSDLPLETCEAPVDHNAKEQLSKLSFSDVASLTDSSLLFAGARERRYSNRSSLSTCSSLEGLARKDHEQDCGSDTDSPTTKMVQFVSKPCKLLSTANSRIGLRRQSRTTPLCAKTFVTI